MSVIRQALCTVVVCYGCLSLGLMYAWPSSTIKIFSSTNTTLNRPMTETEMALYGSLSSISALIATPLTGFLLDALGRKYCCILFSLPQVIAWTLVCALYRVEAILTAMFIAGFGGSLLLVAPVYVGEFCDESIRGRMTSGSVISYGLGMLISYLLGGVLEYDMMLYVCMSLSVLGIAMMTLLADSPTYLMKRGNEKEATKAVSFFRAANIDSKVVMEEINTIRRSLNPDMDDETPENEMLKSDNKPAEKLTFFKFMKKSRSSRRAFFMSLVVYAMIVFQGVVVVQVYAEPLFVEAVPSISPTVLCVLFAVITVVAGLVAAYMVDVAGRRPLLIYSSILTGICCLVLGSQIQLHWGSHWLTAAFMYLYCITYTFGAGTVPYVIGAEVFLPEVRSIATMLAVECAWICNFIVLFVFNPLVSVIGLGGVFYIFAVICFLSSVYSYFYVPETAGLTVDVIQTLFLQKPPRKLAA